MSASFAYRQFDSNLDRLHAEAAGVLQVTVVRADQVSELLLHAMRGDTDASRLFRAARHMSECIANATRRDPIVCAGCPRPLRPWSRFALAVVSPSCDDTTRLLALGICEDCATENSAIGAKAVEALRLIWPESRAIAVTHAASGRA